MLLGIRPVFKCILFWWKCIRIIFALFLQKLYSYKCFVGHKLSLFGMVLRLLLSDEIVLKVRHFLCCIMIFLLFKYMMCTEFKLFLFIFFQMHNCMVIMNFPRYSNCIFYIIFRINFALFFDIIYLLLMLIVVLTELQTIFDPSELKSLWNKILIFMIFIIVKKCTTLMQQYSSW